MHGRYGGLPSWRNPAKYPTSPHGSIAAGDCSDAAVQGLCAGRGMVEARERSCWGTAGAHRSKQRSYVRLRRNTGPKATRHPTWECWRTGKPKSRESPWLLMWGGGTWFSTSDSRAGCQAGSDAPRVHGPVETITAITY
eukprot:scaffold67521_cov72-Phaeocystis_antarctica.AAC.1